MNEADCKRKLVREINALPDGQAHRVEDRWKKGVLDLVIKLPGHPMIWAEGKVVEGNLFAPTVRQWEEGRKWLRVGVPVLLLGWKDSTMYVSPWVQKADIRTCFFSGETWLKTLQHFLEG